MKFIKGVQTSYKKVANALFVLIASLHTHLVFAQSSNGTTTEGIGSIGRNAGNQADGLYFGLERWAYLIGAGMFIVSLILVSSEKYRNQKSVGAAIVMTIIGAILVAWKFFLQQVNNSTIGDGAAETFLNSSVDYVMPIIQYVA